MKPFTEFLNGSIYLCLFSFYLLTPLSLQAQDTTSWPTAIRNVELLFEQYLQKSDELLRQEDSFYASTEMSPLSYAGHACSHCYWPQHQCAILGRMLGKSELINHLEEPLPPITAPLHDVWSAAQSLDQWLHVANSLLRSSHEMRSNVWNLECVGRFDIPTSAYMTDGAESTNFSVSGSYLLVYGDVVDGFYEELLEVLNNHPEIRTVAIGSAGGFVHDALLSGMEIRRRRLRTQLSGPCMSACPLVFMGGISRIVMRPFPTFGFHQMYSDEGPTHFNDPLYQLVSDYAWSMGVDGDWLIEQMRQALPSQMIILGDEEAERDELCRRGLVTGYQGFGSSVC